MAVRLITIDMDIMTRRVVSIQADHGADDDNARRAAIIAVNSNDHRGKNTIAMRPLTRGPTLAVKQGSRNVAFFRTFCADDKTRRRTRRKIMSTGDGDDGDEDNSTIVTRRGQ